MSASSSVLRLVSANIEEGGLGPDNSTARWERIIAGITAWSPDVVCVQEMAARRDPQRIRRHLWATANALGGMIPVLGSEGGISGNHPAILVNPATLTVLDDGPPPRGPGHDPAWCEMLARARPDGPQIRICSVHLPPGSAAEQLMHAQQLASRIAQRGEHAITAGDWNSWSPADPLTVPLEAMPPHLRPARMHARPGQSLTPNHDVHHALAAVGLTDAAAGLDPAHRDPSGLVPTGINNGGRVDRIYVTSELWDSGAVLSYAQKDSGGSDHQMIMITLSLDALASAAAPRPRP